MSDASNDITSQVEPEVIDSPFARYFVANAEKYGYTWDQLRTSNPELSWKDYSEACRAAADAEQAERGG